MARYQVKPAEDGRGPYRWAHVIRTPTGFAQGTIYQQLGDDLSKDGAKSLTDLCARMKFDMRRVK